MSNEVAPPAPDRPPLGLPAGSVRALLALMIVAVVIANTVRERTVELLWTETLMIVLAHYFTSRRFVRLPPDVVRHLEQQGHLEIETNPLYLPRHTIRAVIVLAFAGLGAYLFHKRRLEPESLAILVTVFAYLVGVIGHGALVWWRTRFGGKPWRWWEDAKAIIVLVVLAVTAAAFLLDLNDQLPRRVPLIALALVLFYFGSR